jgi:hypothetical protein
MPAAPVQLVRAQSDPAERPDERGDRARNALTKCCDYGGGLQPGRAVGAVPPTRFASSGLAMEASSARTEIAPASAQSW